MNAIRRGILAAIAALGVAPAALAQTSRKVRVGVLSLGSPPPGPLEAFGRELEQLGYAQGRNLELVWRFAEGRNEQLDAHARDLVSMKVDVLFAVSTPAAIAAKRATADIPIVIARVGDPVHSGLVKSLARPDGNVTGVASTYTDIGAKRLQILKEAIPKATQVTFLWNKGNSGSALNASRIEAASKQLGLQFVSLPVERSEDLAMAFDSAHKKGVSAVLLGEDLFVSSQKSSIVNLGMKHSLPLIAASRDFAEGGAVIAYGPNVSDMYKRAAQYADRILRGAKPRDLPIEQPLVYELVINVRAAQILGLTFSPAFLARADTVIR